MAITLVDNKTVKNNNEGNTNVRVVKGLNHAWERHHFPTVILLSIRAGQSKTVEVNVRATSMIVYFHTENSFTANKVVY